jgi:hypothetical protein
LTSTEQPTHTNTIVSTRLRQTDKRLRKIHSVNSTNSIHDKSAYNTIGRKEYFCNVILEKPTEALKVEVIDKQSPMICRNKNGQFVSPSGEIRSTSTVSIFK